MFFSINYLFYNYVANYALIQLKRILQVHRSFSYKELAICNLKLYITFSFI